MSYRITVAPLGRELEAAKGETLLNVLRAAGLAVDAPCGGDGRCGKCHVTVDGSKVLACRTLVDRDMNVTLPSAGTQQILTDETAPFVRGPAAADGYFLAFDIGTTTVVGYLLEGKSGKERAVAGAQNPQTAYGADVITRIRHGLQGQMEALRDSIRACLAELTGKLCREAGICPEEIRLVCAVGNPAMQQFLLGISVENLAKVPFAPVLEQMQILPAGDILPLWKNAEFVVVPDIAGFVGADTVACILACRQDARKDMTLLVDIGTNGEMVLGNEARMVACSAAAGPALEGALIRFGMRGQAGAIDHVWLENGQLRCSVIGGGKAVGICGSGLLDAAAVALEQGLINERGKILTQDGLLHLTDSIFLTQEDIRQLQLAKGAIAAGIRLMARDLGVALGDIQTVYLAGAFGTYMDPHAACRIGLLPAELEGKITPVGNAAGRGAQILACSAGARLRVQQILHRTRALELSALPEFPRCFAKQMRF